MLAEHHQAIRLAIIRLSACTHEEHKAVGLRTCAFDISHVLHCAHSLRRLLSVSFQGPFLTFEIPHLGSSSPSSFSTWSSLKFSPDGKDLLVSTTERHEWSGSTPLTDAQNFTNQILLIDSYDGSPKQTYVGHEFNPNSANATGATSTATASSSSYASLPFEASFSPDGAFVFAGSRSGSVHSWHTATGEPAAIWNGLNTTAPITAVQFCPTKMALVAGDANGQVLWWIPNL